MRAALALIMALAVPAQAQPYPEAETQALALSQETIALRSVQGPGNKTIDVARVYARALREAGWAESDIEIVPVDDTAYLIATWPGSDPSLGPVVLSAHMDGGQASIRGSRPSSPRSSMPTGRSSASRARPGLVV